MSFLKRIGACSLICAFVLNLLPIHLVAYAANEEFSYVITHFQKYDETTHEILDDDIDSAKPGDVVAVTFAIQNNTANNAVIVAWKQFIRFNVEYFRAYGRDEGDTEQEGDFSESDTKGLNNMVAAAGNPESGVTKLSCGSANNARAKKNATTDFAVVLYKVIDTPPNGDAEFSFLENAENLLTLKETAGDRDVDKNLIDLSGKRSLRIDAPVTYTVKFDGNGATSGSMDNQSFPGGAAATLNENKYAKDGFDFDGWNDKQDGSGNKYADKAQFTPKEGVNTLYAQWEPVYKIEVVQTTGGTVEANKTTAKTGDEVELTVTPDTNNGYVLKDLTVTDKDDKIEPTRSSDMTSASATYKFVVRTSDVKVEATFIKGDSTPKPVKIAVPEEGGKVESDKTEAVKGEEVTLTVTPDTNKGYVLKKLTVTGSDGKDVACQRKETESTNYAFSEYVFKMPDGDEVTEVTVKAEFGIPRLVILPETVEHGSVTSDKQPSAYVGETVTLTVEPETDYQLKVDFPKVTKADGTPITPNKVDEKTYTFVMENSDATVSVEFEPTTPSGKEITVIYASGEGDGDSQTKKERLPFNLPGNPGFASPAGKSLDGWTLPDNQFYAVGTEITELADNSELTAHYSESTTPACYVATAVYGSYDCPEVWTLRRFRDHVLAKTWYGRLFIKLYYAVSPTAVRLFGDTAWFRNFWRGKLDSMVASLQADGFESTPYQDMDW